MRVAINPAHAHCAEPRLLVQCAREGVAPSQVTSDGGRYLPTSKILQKNLKIFLPSIVFSIAAALYTDGRKTVKLFVFCMPRVLATFRRKN